MGLNCLIEIKYLSDMYAKCRGDVTLEFKPNEVHLMGGDDESTRTIVPASSLKHYECNVPCAFVINQVILDPFYNAIEMNDSEQYFRFEYDEAMNVWCMDYE